MERAEWKGAKTIGVKQGCVPRLLAIEVCGSVKQKFRGRTQLGVPREAVRRGHRSGTAVGTKERWRM